MQNHFNLFFLLGPVWRIPFFILLSTLEGGSHFLSKVSVQGMVDLLCTKLIKRCLHTHCKCASMDFLFSNLGPVFWTETLLSLFLYVTCRYQNVFLWLYREAGYVEMVNHYIKLVNIFKWSHCDVTDQIVFNCMQLHRTMYGAPFPHKLPNIKV